jgi:hypothetical protein
MKRKAKRQPGGHMPVACPDCGVPYPSRYAMKRHRKILMGACKSKPAEL